MSAQRVGALSASEICELARQGDALALEAVQREALYIGLGLANLVTMYCPQTIVVGGGMMRSADLLLAPALDLVKRICTQVPVENTSIVLAGLGAQCGLLGGACVWFHQAGVN
jgi:glucokinase